MNEHQKYFTASDVVSFITGSVFNVALNLETGEVFTCGFPDN